MFRLGRMLGVLSLFVVPLSAEEGRRGRFWKASVVALAGATAADAASSVGRIELNPVLRSADGRFGARGIAIKAAISGGAVFAQWLLLRKNPEAEKYAATANFLAATTFTSVAFRNATNQRSRPAYLFNP